MYIASGVKGKVQPAISDIDQVVLNALALRERRRVDEFGSTHFLCPRIFRGVRIDSNDPRSTDYRRGRDDTETDGTASENGDVGALCVPYE